MRDKLVELFAQEPVADLPHGIQRVQAPVMDDKVDDLGAHLSGILGQRRRDPLALACAVGHKRLLPACSKTNACPFVFNEFQTRVHQELIRWVVLPQHRFLGQPWTAWTSRSLCSHGGRQPGSERLKCVCDVGFSFFF